MRYIRGQQSKIVGKPRGMRKFVLVFLLFLGAHMACLAVTPADKLMALVKLAPENITRDKVMILLGKPTRIAENRKGSTWYYTVDNTKLTLQWNKRSGMAEQFSFSCGSSKSCGQFDKKKECKLKEGLMNMQQALTLLGPPKEMTVKEGKQIMYYNYKGNMLRLFFRNRTLVDYALVENRRE